LPAGTLSLQGRDASGASADPSLRRAWRVDIEILALESVTPFAPSAMAFAKGDILDVRNRFEVKRINTASNTTSVVDL